MSLSVFRRNPYALGLSIAALAVLAACGGSDGPTTPVATPEPAEQYVPPEPPSGYTPKTISYANKDMVAAANPLAVKA
ncbi:MAG: gamma-glutamyltransferase, partial [Betaproteobacteria bacterium]